jgi:predicted NBD/HSP70 family sugar kinase
VTSNPELRLTERRIVAALCGRDGASRVELTRLTGLPRTTVVAAVASLLRRGLLVERDEPSDGPRPVGRPASAVSLADPAGPVAVIAFGHSESSVGVCDFGGTVLGRRSLAMTDLADLDSVLAAVRAALGELGAPPLSVGVVGVPLPFQRGRGAVHVRRLTPALLDTFPNLQPAPDWLLADPSERFAQALGAPVVAENDANLAALGEAVSGAGRGRRCVVYVSAADGIGAGLVFDGRLHRGAAGLAGELAHVSVEDDGELCLCGNRGCLATVFRNGPQLIDQIQTAYGQPISFDDLQTLAAHGDAGVRRILTDLGRMIGRPLADLSVLLNPDVIVIDGTLGEAGRHVVDGVREAIDRHSAPMISEAVAVRPGTLGADAALFGAVALARERHHAGLVG